MTISTQAPQAVLISGIRVPSSKPANEITDFIHDTESTLLFNRSSRVYYFFERRRKSPRNQNACLRWLLPTSMLLTVQAAATSVEK
ncbi:hypothetical protein BDD14_3732 [Edaphobacter modestus]|uniref:Uncharacterized protein n=1 Tax=Edaphobacter modestus TaxID=388466 RepID=A0A4Q7YXK8_9BACT|nr:hypothetical protein BDD14_3732 [Edaphobacter modestus]